MADPTPTCTIVVSSRNHGDTLFVTLESILNQEQVQVECIVIDSSTSDISAGIKEKFAGALSVEHVSESEHAAAVTSAFNRSRGEVMWWASGADKLCPWAVRLSSFVFQNVPSVRWLTSGTPLTWTHSQMSISTGLADGYARRAFFAGRNLQTSPYFHFPIWREGTMWRRSLWEACGSQISYALEQAGDFELWVRFWQHAELYTMNIPLGGTQASAANRNDAAYWSAATQHLERAGKLPAPTRAALRAQGQLIRRRPSLRDRYAQPAPHIWISPPSLECGVSQHYIL